MDVAVVGGVTIGPIMVTETTDSIAERRSVTDGLGGQTVTSGTTVTERLEGIACITKDLN